MVTCFHGSKLFKAANTRKALEFSRWKIKINKEELTKQVSSTKKRNIAGRNNIVGKKTFIHNKMKV
jgi:hypothetical protein